MNDNSNKQKKVSISEEDVSTILQRYTATTVLALLQEVAQVQAAKIDWNELVKRTTTGITNPREYQMLWRHLAYRDELQDKLEDGVKPLDDDSDLECDLETFPPVSNEASIEATACVKVLIASGSASDSGIEKGLTIEAPLTINIPDSKSTSESQQNVRGTNITVPVSVQRQPQTVVATSTDEVDKNGAGSGGNLPPRRKRKPWSTAEDMELFAAVKKCGEGNWANILKGDFKGDRTASQLSQRWNIIKKRNNNNSNSNVKTGTQLSEMHQAARRALSMALDPPGPDTMKASSSLGRTKSSINPIASMRPTMADTSATTLHQDPPNEDSAITKTLPNIRPKTSPSFTPDPVKAAAVAAGARIATPSAAAAILKQQLKSAIHIKPGVTNFRDLHSPNGSRPIDHNPNVGPSNPVSTATQEPNGASSAMKLQGEQTPTTVKLETFQETSGKEVNENAGLSVVEPVMMETCESQNTKQEQQ